MYLLEQYHYDKEMLLKTDMEQYQAWSFQACQYDPANPAFYIKDRNSYRDWGKNKEKN